MAVVKKKTIEIKLHHQKQNSETKTLFVSLRPSSLPNVSALKTVSIGRTRHIYEWSHDIYITGRSFLELFNRLYKRKQKQTLPKTEQNEIPVFPISMFHVDRDQQWSRFLFCLPRAPIHIHFSRDTTGNRKEPGIKIGTIQCSCMILLIHKLTNLGLEV